MNRKYGFAIIDVILALVLVSALTAVVYTYTFKTNELDSLKNYSSVVQEVFAHVKTCNLEVAQHLNVYPTCAQIAERFNDHLNGTNGAELWTFPPNWTVTTDNSGSNYGFYVTIPGANDGNPMLVTTCTQGVLI
jgi:type II secretory pathway pseudopilin PulG